MRTKENMKIYQTGQNVSNFLEILTRVNHFLSKHGLQRLTTLYCTRGQPVLRTECVGAQRSHGSGQIVHGKSQNFLKHNVSCKSMWIIQAHSKS